jgi:ATP-dependent DNA helicase DinG
MPSPDLVCDANDLIESSLVAFDAVVKSNPDFRHRAGQYDMARCIAETLAGADLGEMEAPRKALAVIQAGTGVGKSAAYASTVIAQALKREVRVIIATATVALQEQLMNKDLPLLAKYMPQPFKYALAKGRGRYMCLMKCDRAGPTFDDEDDLFENMSHSQQKDTQAREKRRKKLTDRMIRTYETGEWNGERDTWEESIDASDWSHIGADRYTCTGRHCAYFKECSYFKARQQLVDADVIVANHALVLASLDSKTLPDLDKCLIVFDEAHHLPTVALDQFSSTMDVQNLRWLDKLPKILSRAASFTQTVCSEDITEQCAQAKVAAQDIARLAMDMVLASNNGKNGSLRFANGVVPDALCEILRSINQIALSLFGVVNGLMTALKNVAKEDPSRASACAQEVSGLGPYQPKIVSLLETSTLLLEQGDQPLAKWLMVEGSDTFLQISANACPIAPSDLLNQFLWHKVRAAVLTSASLTSCGRFDFFLNECGLQNKSHVQTLAVDSPFDYAKQGVLEVVATKSDPKNVAGYTKEMKELLLNDLQKVKRGALVLFTSKVQMQSILGALSASLLEIVLVQGQMSRQQLLAQHEKRVQTGSASIIFGLQSFGEGLDLSGALCETLFITKIPFASPANPIGETRAEWLQSLGRDSFTELVIPATGMKLLQWTGRAIRTENDTAHIICYDKRLTQKSFGRLMLAGLPNYELLER